MTTQLPNAKYPILLVIERDIHFVFHFVSGNVLISLFIQQNSVVTVRVPSVLYAELDRTVKVATIFLLSLTSKIAYCVASPFYNLPFHNSVLYVYFTA